MELRQLRFFLALAEELHFGRAAERENIGQPALSLHVARLEAELGVKLFFRTSRRVELTEAGRSILASTRLAVQHAEEAQQIARLAARGQRGRLRVSFAMAADLSPASELVHSFRQANVDVTIEQRVDYEQVVVDTVRAGSADVGFVWLSPEPASQLPPELAVEPQLTDAVVAVCRSSHHLARRTFVSGEALSREPLVLLPRELAPALWGLVRGVRTADIRQEPSFPAIINAVRREGMVGLVPACITGAVGCAEVVHRPCEHPAPRLTLWLAWRRHEQSPLRESFVEHCRSLRELTPSALVAS